MKKFNDNGEILEQQSIRLKVQDCQDAETFMSAIEYKKLMTIIEKDFAYQKYGFELMTKAVKSRDRIK